MNLFIQMLVQWTSKWCPFHIKKNFGVQIYANNGNIVASKSMVDIFKRNLKLCWLTCINMLN